MPKDLSSPEKLAKKERKEKKAKKAAEAASKVDQVEDAATTEDAAPAPTEEPAGDEADDPNLLEIDLDKPAPPSKAALRKAKAKGLPLPSDAVASTSATTTASAADEGADSTEVEVSTVAKVPKVKAAPAQKYSIWVGNLAFKTTEDQVRQFFSAALVKGKWAAKDEDEAGKEEDEEEATITRINMPKSGPSGKRGPNKGFAYIDFSTEAACHRAVKLSEGHLDGRALLIKLGTDFASRPATAASAALPDGQTKSRTVQAILAKQKNPASPTLFVGNLGFEATEDSLRTLIETHWSTSMSSNRHSSKVKKSSFRPEPEELAAAAAAVAGGSSDSGSDSDSDSDSDDEDGKKVKAKVDARKAKKSEANVEKATVVGKDGQEEEVVVSGAGLRKIRMGQFQDTGRCKGFAFFDFHTTAQATAALIDTRNHRLDGRALTLEYASTSAAGRSGTGTNSFNTPILPEGASAAEVEAATAAAAAAAAGPKKNRKALRPMKKERIAARIAAGLPPTVPVDAPNNPAPPPRNRGGERLNAKRSRGDGEGDEGGEAGAGTGGEDGAEGRDKKRERKGPMAKWEKAGRPRPGAALAMAKRETVAIVESTGTKMVFD